MRVGTTQNVRTSTVESVEAMDVWSVDPGSVTLQVDMNRTDIYTPDGTTAHPFKTLEAALAIANASASAATPYVVVIASGTLAAGPVTIAPYVSVQGAGWQSTNLVASDLIQDFITLSEYASLGGVVVYGPTSPAKAAIRVDGAADQMTHLHSVMIARGTYGLHVVAGFVVAHDVAVDYQGSTIDRFIQVDGSSRVLINQAICVAPADEVTIGYGVTGAAASLTLLSPLFDVPGTTDAVFVDDDASCFIQGGLLQHGGNALHLGSNGSPFLKTEALTIYGSGVAFTNDILINSATSVVYFGGSCDLLRINNAAGGDLHASGMDISSGTEGSFILGDQWTGRTINKMLHVTDYGRDTYFSGLGEGGVVTRNAGLMLNVSTGSGYINDGADPVQIHWEADTVTLGANQANEYIYVTSAGVISHSTTKPAYTNSIVLARARTSATEVVLLSNDEIVVTNALAKLAVFMEGTIGPLAQTGVGTLAHATPLAFYVTLGTYWVGLSERTVAGTAAGEATFTAWYRDGAGDWTLLPGQTTVDDENYDDGSGTLSAIPGGQYTNHTVYVVVGGDGDEYHVVYGQDTFASAADAQGGVLPGPPDILKEYACRSGSIIVLKSAGVIDSIVDVRPQVGQYATVGGGVAGDHDLLLNLANDTHPQYLTTGRADTWLVGKSGNAINLVDNGNAHDHSGGDGAQINHTTLSNVGTKTHLQLEGQVDTHIADMATAHGSTATPTASRIPIADANATVDGWVTFGSDYQFAAAVARTTNDTTTFQNQVTLATGALTGTYALHWDAVIDHGNPGSSAEIRFYNVTDGVIIGTTRIFRPGDATETGSQSGTADLVLAGVSKTVAVQFRAQTVGTAGCSDAHIRFYRVA